ncbi:hypothetical protein DL98DRAFT_620685, partial [Cadophora sp. DSE1049]
SSPRTTKLSTTLITGYDTPGILHGFSGDDWQAGTLPLYEVERRNFMFAAQSTNWLAAKQAYDLDQTTQYFT